jgi:hypothetical protein
MRRLILRNLLSPGDIVMLTAAVRDLHLCYPGKFLTDTRTPCPALWENNPYVTALDEHVPDVEVIDCEYPLIHESNQLPYHFVHGFSQHLNSRLGLSIRPKYFHGDIHISDLEKSWFSQAEEIVREALPFWIVVAGGKRDYTAKCWDPRRYQQVVDYFRGRILFVQVGDTAPRSPSRAASPLAPSRPSRRGCRPRASPRAPYSAPSPRAAGSAPSGSPIRACATSSRPMPSASASRRPTSAPIPCAPAS